jgi:hypothetical protein
MAVDSIASLDLACYDHDWLHHLHDEHRGGDRRRHGIAADCIAYMASTAGLIGGRPGGGVPRPVLQACSMTLLGPEHADGGGAASERLQLVLLVTCGSGGAVLGGAGRTVSRWWWRGAAGEEAPQSQPVGRALSAPAALTWLLSASCRRLLVCPCPAWWRLLLPT